MFLKRRYHNRLLFFLTLLSLLHVIPGDGQGQITLDGSLGPATSLTGPDYEITADLGRIVGSNLFHSFDAFRFFAGESATFTGPDAVENVIGRVTGGEASFIDGPLGCAIPDANLFLLNPGGVVFGPNASLDVDGSFHVSAGDYFRLGDEGFFYADLSNNTSLAAAPPAAFGFLGDSPGGVSIQGCELRVPDGESFSAAGGNVEIIDGRLVAPGGRLNISGVASPGEVLPDDSNQTPDLHMNGFSNLGDIHVSGGSTLTISGDAEGSLFIRGNDMDLDGSRIFSTAYTTQAGGDIDIRLTGDLRVTNGAVIDASAYWTGSGGDILIDARRLDLVEGSRIISDAKADSLEHAGDITISTADSVVISGEGAEGVTSQSVSCATFGKGDGGRISISTPELIINDGAGIFLMAYFGFDMFGNVVTGGDAGDLFLDVGRLDINDARIISQNGAMTTGRAGDITINAGESVSIFNSGGIHAATHGSGDAGTIYVTTPKLEIENSVMAAFGGEWSQGGAGEIILDVGHLALANNAWITTHAEGAGDAGSIHISTPFLEIDESVVAAHAQTDHEADAGEILLNVGRLNLINGGQISSSTEGSGVGNHVKINASEGVLISGQNPDGSPSAIISGSSGDGNAGAVSISSPELTLVGGVVGTGAGANGDAGDIIVDVERLTLENGGRLQSNTIGEGQGGAIRVSASESIFISGKDDSGYPAGIHGIAFSVGVGGDIEIHGGRVQIAADAVISAESVGMGDAGAITLRADDTLRVENGSVWTEARQADGGDIQLFAGNLIHLKEGEIGASVNGGPETTGGNITSESAYVVLEKSAVTANAYEGAGGNIRIVADVFLADPESVVDASSALGIDGRVDIQAPIQNINGAITPLREDFLNAAALLREPCAARIREGKYNSLVIGGRDGLPLEPGGPLPSPLF
ncbi:MAG: S-layer family protein [Desulfobacterales bacterium]|nr:S-layer family protein [Desulfobacterales bacterium]